MIDAQLITFISLCKTKNYTKTAEELYVTQPSVTHHIKALEKMYNVKLFVNSNKNFTLTKEGALLYQYALKLYSFDAEFERMLNESIKGEQKITFAVTAAANLGFLKAVLPKWSNRNSNIKYSMTERKMSEIVKDFSVGLIDFAIVDYPFNRKSYQTIPLCKTKLVLAVSRNHKLSTLKRVSYDQITKYRLIIEKNENGKQDFIKTELKLKNRYLSDFKDLIEVDNPLNIIDLVIEGFGMAFFYESEIENEIRTGKVIALYLNEIKNDVELSLIYNKNNLAATKYENIAKELINIAKELNYLNYSSS